MGQARQKEGKMQLTGMFPSWLRAPKARARRLPSSVAAVIRTCMVLASLLSGVAATAATPPPPAVFVVETTYNLPMNNPNAGHSLDPTFSAGTSGWGLRVSSAITPNSTRTTLDMTNDTCQRSNGVGGGTRVDVYVMGPSGTPYQIQYDWTAAVSANAWRTTALWANTLYSSFGNVSVYANPGQSDTGIDSAHGVDAGFTTGRTLSSGGVDYSFAKSYHLSGSTGSNGQCFTCAGNCCDCGLGRSTQTLTATVGCKLDVNPVLRQNIGYWATAPYDHSGSIGENGCALTSLIMALNFAANTSLDPYWLNSFMTSQTPQDGFNGGGVLFGKTIRDVSHELRGNAAKQLEWKGQTVDSRLGLAAAERVVEDVVCKEGYPEIVGVKLRLDPKRGVLVPNHYVLVTGKEGNRFTIIDPYDSSMAYLDQYYVDGGAPGYRYSAGFVTRGYVQDPPVVSGLHVYSAAANLLLLDPLGRRAGLDLGSGEEMEEIPGAVHYLDALENDETGELPEEVSQLIEITAPPEGTYRLLATALQDGPFQITLQSYSEDGSEQPPIVLEGQATAGETRVYKIDFSAAPGASLQAVRCEVSLTAPPAVLRSTGLGAVVCAGVVSDATLGAPAASATCSSVEVRRQGVPAGNVFPVGTTDVTYTAEDDFGTTASASQPVIVTDGTPPVLTIPPGIETSNDPGAASAILDPGEATVSDNCVARRLEALRSDGLSLSAPYPIGTTTITWTATDDAGNVASGKQPIEVRDVESPVLSGLSVDKPVLWPPNHKMIDVTVGYQVTDNSGEAPACSLSVASNEAVNGTGDGDATPDWIVLDAHRLRLRAERSGRGNGRVYTVTLTCADAAGNAASQLVTVSVPKSSPNGSKAP